MSQLSSGQVFVNITPVVVIPPYGIETSSVAEPVESVGKNIDLTRKSAMSSSCCVYELY